MKKVKIILGYLMSFFAFILFTMLIVILVIKYTIGDKDEVKQIIKSINYYELVSNEIQEEMEDTIVSTGFEKDILDGLYTTSMVIDDINIFIDNAYNGNKTDLDRNEVMLKLNNNINSFIKKSNLDIVNKDDLESFEKEIMDIYINEVTLYGMLDSFIPVLGKIIQYMDKVIIALEIMFVGMIILLMIIHQGKFLGSIVMSSGLVILFLYIVIYENIDINNLLIVTENFSLVLIRIIEKIGMLLLDIGLLIVVIGFIFSLTSSCKGKENLY